MNIFTSKILYFGVKIIFHRNWDYNYIYVYILKIIIFFITLSEVPSEVYSDPFKCQEISNHFLLVY